MGSRTRKDVLALTKLSKGSRIAALLLAVLTLGFVIAGILPAAFADTEDQVLTTGAEPPALEPDSDRFAKSNYPKLPENASFGERVSYGLKVVGIGMGIVFLVLIILMAVLYVFKLVATSKTKKEKQDAVKAPEDPGQAAIGTGENEEETIVAIATAAIAASRGESDCAFRVISVTKLS